LDLHGAQDHPTTSHLFVARKPEAPAFPPPTEVQGVNNGNVEEPQAAVCIASNEEKGNDLSPPALPNANIQDEITERAGTKRKFSLFAAESNLPDLEPSKSVQQTNCNNTCRPFLSVEDDQSKDEEDNHKEEEGEDLGSPANIQDEPALQRTHQFSFSL
jgi:hypothetical protein